MAESVASLTAQLASVDAAIARAESNQSVSSDSTSATQADLAVLYKRRDDLQRRLEQAQAVAAGGGASRMFGRTRVTGIGSNYG